MEPLIFHIDVNSAYLSWTSTENMRTGTGPDHHLYHAYSQRLMTLLESFCPYLEQLSIDECFLDMGRRAIAGSTPKRWQKRSAQRCASLDLQ